MEKKHHREEIAFAAVAIPVLVFAMSFTLPQTFQVLSKASVVGNGWAIDTQNIFLLITIIAAIAMPLAWLGIAFPRSVLEDPAVNPLDEIEMNGEKTVIQSAPVVPKAMRCDSCGAPLNPSKQQCEYCGTWYR